MTAASRVRAAIATLIATLAYPVSAQGLSDQTSIIPLYPRGALPSVGRPETQVRRDDGAGLLILNVSEPTLAVFRPASGKANGAAVIVAPGGGFVGLEYEAGGTAAAKALAARGITAFVLKYRTIRSDGDPTHLPPAHLAEMNLLMARAKSGVPVEVPRFAGEPRAVEDGARAVAIVRQRAAEWGVDPHRVGVLGFSAGGYLAADLAIGSKATRPDFVGLIYGGLRTPVPADASPAFIAAAADDEFQPDDAALLYAAWHRAGASAELHLYEHGGHGFDLRRQGTTSDHWLEEFVWWLQSRGYLASRRTE